MNRSTDSVGGIRERVVVTVCRQDMNRSTDSVGGIRERVIVIVCRQDMNDPPTPSVGFGRGSWS